MSEECEKVQKTKFKSKKKLKQRVDLLADCESIQRNKTI